MSRTERFVGVGSLLSVVALILAACGSPAAPTPAGPPQPALTGWQPGQLLVGVWENGGNLLELDANGGRLHQGCVESSIAQPFRIDARGHFTATGTTSNFGGAPLPTYMPAFHDTQFSGWIDGAKLMLLLSGTGQEPAGTPYTLYFVSPAPTYTPPLTACA